MALSLRNAFMISLAAHALVIGALACRPAPAPIKEESREVAVDYVVLKEAARPEETPKVEMARHVDVKPEPSVAPAEEPKDKEPEKRAVDADALAKKEARVRSTEDYINYYQLIREKIRRQLKIKYRDYSAEGEIQVAFALAADGRLESVAIDRAKSSPDERLVTIAESSVRSASPFPPFPKAVDLPKMSFNLAVSFKKR